MSSGTCVVDVMGSYGGDQEEFEITGNGFKAVFWGNLLIGYLPMDLELRTDAK
jgi:hypothetical protein